MTREEVIAGLNGQAHLNDVCVEAAALLAADARAIEALRFFVVECPHDTKGTCHRECRLCVAWERGRAALALLEQKP